MPPQNQKRKSNKLSQGQLGAVLAATERLSEKKGEGTTIVVADAVADLIDALGTGNSDRIERALISLGAERDSSLFRGVGAMARNLHDSLREFQLSLCRETASMDGTNIPDAADKLEAVIKMTFEAADKTLSFADRQTEILREIKEQRTKLDAYLEDPSLSTDILKGKVKEFLSSVKKEEESLAQINSEVVMAQSYQDLTGQALRKVVKLVTSLEKQLLDLISLFGLPIQGAQHEVATPTPDTKGPGALDQDKADDLLKSLGF